MSGDGALRKITTSSENKTSAFINVSKKLGPGGLSNGIDDFSPFIHQVVLTLDPKSDVKFEVRILRDTGSKQTVVSKRVCQALGVSLENPEQYVMLKTVTGRTTLSVVSVYLDSELYTGLISVAAVEEMLLNGVGCILANDVMQNSTCKSELPRLLADPRRTSEGEGMENVFPCCVITRSRANKRPMVQELDKVCTVNGSGCPVMSLPKTPDVSVVDDYRDIIVTADSHINDNKWELSVRESESIVTGKNGLVMMQQRDPQLAKIRRRAPIESNITNCNGITYFMCDGVLMRRCILTDDLSDPYKVRQRIVKQIVLPPENSPHVLSLAHDVKTAGHLGRTKTTFKLLQSFYLPGAYSDVSNYVKSCHNCQISGKAGQHPAKAPLIPIPVMSEPFQKIQIDCVGPLNPTSKGNMYLLTIMCTATRYPEAFPLNNIKSICNALKTFFCQHGFPKVTQSDRGTNLTGNLFKQLAEQFDIKHVLSSAYHPES